MKQMGCRPSMNKIKPEPIRHTIRRVWIIFLRLREGTMRDTFGRDITYLRLSVTELCNLRCRYCMPEDGVCKKSHEEMLTEDELVLAAKAAAELGITKIRITGGEPLVKRNILHICERISAIEGIKELCLTTNGTMLEEFALPLKKAGVSRLNISLDTLDREKFEHITRRNNFEDALSGIEAAVNAGFEKIKINAVLIGGFNDDEIAPLANLTKKYPVDVRFIELMPMYDSGDFTEKAYIPTSEVIKKLPDAVALPKNDGVAALYKLPDAMGNIGLISAVSNHFCGSCNRIRITADGKIKPCLHSDMEFSIKGLDYEDVKAQLETAILAKPACHDPLSAKERSHAGRNMNQIGG